MKHGVACVISLAVFAGCMGSEPVRFVSPSFYAQAPGQVAVLPFDNESTDLVGPEMLRGMVATRLRGHGYAPVAVETVNEKLRAIGITDGGQLRAVASQKLRDALGVEGLFYGGVEDFAFLNVGFAIRRVVRLRMKFVRASTGETLWEDTGEGITERFTFKKKEAERAYMEGVIERAAELAFRTPLMPESLEAVRGLFLRLPVMTGTLPALNYGL